MSRAERAKSYFLQGYACSQAVALAFSDVVGVDEGLLSKMTLPFGGGVGRMRLTCGCVSGMATVVGLIFSEEENTSENKRKVYAVVQTLCKRFQEEFGSLLCGELLSGMNLKVEVGGRAEERTQEYYKKRSCADMVAFAAEVLESYLHEQGKL